MYVIVCMVAVLESFIVTTGETIPSEAIPKEASNYYEMTWYNYICGFKIDVVVLCLPCTLYKEDSLCSL